MNTFWLKQPLNKVCAFIQKGVGIFALMFHSICSCLKLFHQHQMNVFINRDVATHQVLFSWDTYNVSMTCMLAATSSGESIHFTDIKISILCTLTFTWKTKQCKRHEQCSISQIGSQIRIFMMFHHSSQLANSDGRSHTRPEAETRIERSTKFSFDTANLVGLVVRDPVEGQHTCLLIHIDPDVPGFRSG